MSAKQFSTRIFFLRNILDANQTHMLITVKFLKYFVCNSTTGMSTEQS